MSTRILPICVKLLSKGVCRPACPRVRVVSLKPITKAHFSSRSSNRRGKSPIRRRKAATPAVIPVEEAWVEVKDEPSGMSYWWNQQTNETTHLGEPKPLGATAMTVPPPAEVQQQSGGMGSGLGRVVAEGMAFGVGSSIAHHAVGAIANSFGGDDDGGDDGIDI